MLFGGVREWVPKQVIEEEKGIKITSRVESDVL